MNTLIGLLIIAVGSFGQSSSYVPINKVKGWSWENFWLVQGIFAWLVFPLLGALLAIPADGNLIELWGAGGALPAIIYGVLWGVGGLTFGLSMRYLGVALGQSIALGTCAGFGTLFPALFAGKDLLHGDGLMLLIGVCITLAGIAIIGYAGSLRSKNMSEEEKKAAVKDFALTKGLLVALLAGVRSYLSNQERTAGFLQAFQEEGLSIPPELILETGSWLYDAAEKVCLNFFNTYTGEMPTALFAFNDRLATGAINAICKTGRTVPDDVSVIGYDNLGYYNIISPRITTVETHIEAISESTVMHMIWQLNNGSCLPVKVLTPVEVISGETVRSLLC